MPGPGSLSLGARVIGRELRSQPAVVVSLLVTVVLSTFVIAGAPRLLQEVAEDDLYATVSDPPPSQRNITVQRAGQLSAGSATDPFAPTRRVGDSFGESRLPGSVKTVVSGHYFVVESPQFVVSPLPGEDPPHPFPTFLRFRYQEHIGAHSTLVSGDLPSPQEPVTMLVGDECPRDPEERDALGEQLATGEIEQGASELDCHLVDVPHYQVAVTAETAEDMGLEIGRRMVLTADLTDPAYFGVFGDFLGFQFVVSISGIVGLTDPTEEYWFGDPTLHKPNIQENADRRIIFARGLIAPEEYGAMLSDLGQSRWSYSWRFFVDPDRVRVADLDDLRSDLDTLGLDFSSVGARATELVVVTRLPDLLAAHAAQRAQSVALMSLSVAALFAVVVAVSVLLAILMTERRRSVIILMRSRGASSGQLTMTRLYESLLIVAPAAALGYGGAYAVLASTNSLGAYRATVGLAAAIVASLVAAGLGLFRRRLGSLHRDHPGVTTRSPRRVVWEVLVLVLTIGATVLARRRGQTEDTVAPGVDLLLAAVPALIGLASAIITLRVYPHLIRVLAWVGSLRRGVVWFIGFRRVLLRSPAHSLPVMVLLICVTTATFASVERVSIASGQEASSWQAVGADYAVKGFGADVTLPSGIDVGQLADPGDVAMARSFANARAETESGSLATEVLAVTPAYDRIAADSPSERRLPGSLRVAAGGTTADPIPVIASSAWPNGYVPALGDVLQLDLGRLRPTVEIVEVRDRYPDIAVGIPFFVLSLDTLANISELPLPPTVAYIRAGPEAGDRLLDLVASQASGARVISRYGVVDTVGSDPFVHWVSLGLLIIAGLSAAFAIASVLSALGLASAARRRDIAYLRTMGLDTRQSAWLTMVEQAPAVVIGVVAGVATGLVAALLLEPAVTIDAFTGGLVPSHVTISWPALAVISGVLLVVTAIAVVVSVSMTSHDEPSRILRVAE